MEISVARRLMLKRTVLRNAVKEMRGAVRDRILEQRDEGRFRSFQADDVFTVAVHFSGGVKSAYQLKQWLWPLERLSEALVGTRGAVRPVAVYCRSISMAAEIARHTVLPVRFGRLSHDIDAFFAENPLRVVFYVNQNLLNFQAIRYSGPAHVHLSHGESEKVSMISNQLKAYDRVFIAGEAARERIQRHLIDLSSERLRAVGRPQMDEVVDPPSDWQRDPRKRTVFYAPTWEGDAPAMAYSSVARSGEAIVGSFIDAGWQVIYRPHPHTGTKDPATRTADERIVRMLDSQIGVESTGSTASVGRHYVDRGTSHGWQHLEADVCVCDMSAIAFDWLASGKPILMMEPNPGAEVDRLGLVGQIPVVPQPAAASLAVTAENELISADFEALRILASHYFGDITPGSQIALFIREVLQLVEERDGQLRDQRRVLDK